MEHHGGPIDPKGFCIAFKKQECHLEYDKRFENQKDRNGTSVFPYVGCRDHYGPGELVWFDTEAEGWDFVRYPRLKPVGLQDWFPNSHCWHSDYACRQSSAHHRAAA